MYRFVLLVFFVLFSNTVKAQYIVKDFFDKNGKLTTQDKSYYYRIGEKVVLMNDTGDLMLGRRDTVFVDTVFTFYSHNSQMRSKEFFVDGALVGSYEFYYPNGKLKEGGTYAKGIKDGTIAYWYENGQRYKRIQYTDYVLMESGMVRSFLIHDYWDKENNQIVKNGDGVCSCYLENDSIREEGNVVKGLRDGNWSVFSKDVLLYQELYDVGIFKSGKSFHEGKEISYTEVERQAEFKGGVSRMMEFLAMNIKYPKEAKISRTQGRVFVKFIIDKKGNIRDCSVLSSPHESFSREALRVVRLMPKWKPGTQRGVPVNSQFVLPIVFRQ